MDESRADDGGIHRFYRFTRERGVDPVELDDLVRLLLLILFFDQVADTVAEPV